MTGELDTYGVMMVAAKCLQEALPQRAAEGRGGVSCSAFPPLILPHAVLFANMT